MPKHIPSPRLIAPAIFLIATSLAGQARSAEFHAIDRGPSGAFFQVPFRGKPMSEDGTMVVGTAGGRSAVWTREGGLESPYARWTSVSLITSIAGDGETMTGTAGNYAYKLVDDSVMRLDPPAGFIDSYPQAISRDGRTVIGSVATSAFESGPGYWTREGSFSFIEGNGFTPRNAFGVSADGAVIVGSGINAVASRAFRWTPQTNAQLLPLLSPEDTRSNAWNVSADGRWTVGWSGPIPNPHEIQAVRWDGISNPEPLFPVHDGWGSRALRVSDDGRTIAGDLFPSEDQSEQLAGLWTEETGFVPLQDLLANEHGLEQELAGWHLRATFDMSGDGRFVLGDGWNPQGDFQLFLVDLAPTGLPGDYNGNGTVEQADLDLVLLNWGTTNVPAEWTQELPNGLIDQAELDGVLLNWGNTTAAAFTASAAVPEPSSLTILATCLAGLAIASRQAAQRRHSASRAA